MYKPTVVKWKHVHFYLMDLPGHVVFQMVWVRPEVKDKLLKDDSGVVKVVVDSAPRCRTKDTQDNGRLLRVIMNSMKRINNLTEEYLVRKSMVTLCEDEGCPHHGTKHVCNPGE